MLNEAPRLTFKSAGSSNVSACKPERGWAVKRAFLFAS
jgi:hypothetical protein